MNPQTIKRLSIALFVSLLLWGGYQTIHFFGTPAHIGVLVTAESLDHIETVCGADAYFCRGLRALLPAIVYTFARWQSVAGYVIWSVVALVAFFVVQAMRGSEFGRVRVQMRPWHFVALFIASVWLLFSVLTKFEVDGRSFRSVIEPHPEIYLDAGGESLQTLEDNFVRLEERGCLSFNRQILPDANEYTMRSWCVHGFFVSRVLTQFIFLLLIGLLFLSIGRAILARLPLQISDRLFEATASFGLGACAMIVYLWLMAVFGIYTAVVGWTSLVLLFIIFYRQARYWLLACVRWTMDIEIKWNSIAILGFWLLVSYLALNFLTVIRPFPIGWDDLGQYMNQPRLLVSYGSFIHSMSPFRWEYLSSLGYLLYGYESYHGATAAMLINWMAGLFAVATVAVTSRAFLGERAGLLSSSLYYLLPLVGHFSFADMKIDNAVFAMSALGFLCAMIAVFKVADDKRARLTWIALAGVFLGFAFGFKVTAIMTALAAAAIMAGVLWHWLGFAAVSFGSIAIFALMGSLKTAQISERVGVNLTKNGLIGGSLLLALVCIAYLFWKHRERAAQTALSFGVFAAAFLAAIAPWILHNNIQAGNIIPKLIFSAPDRHSALLDIAGAIDPATTEQEIRKLPPELAIDPESPACTGGTALAEELDRYWGYEKGWSHYLTLPWRMVMNMDSPGYYVTTSPVMLLFPLLLLLPFFWLAAGRWLRWLFAATIFMLVEWMFMGNGVPWYGIGVFLGLVVGIEALYLRAPDAPNRSALGALLVLGFISCLNMRAWQFEMQINLLEYPMGKSDGPVMQERTIPFYDDISALMVQRYTDLPERPYAYRIGTFIPYFIPRNLEIIGLQDHQLDAFRCLNQEGDHMLTYRRLLALGINNIVFDTNTDTIERDPNGTLHKKVDAFVDFLNDPALPLELAINAPDMGIVFVLLNDLPATETAN